MAKYSNPGNVNVAELERIILNAGGGKNVTMEGNVTHVSLYETVRNWHLSYDILPDGSITKVHSTLNNIPIYNYKSGH